VTGPETEDPSEGRRPPKPGRVRRCLRWLLLAAGGYVLLHATVLCFPRVLFTQSVTRHGITLRARDAIGPGAGAVLDRVHALISASELYDETVQREVVLIDSFGLSRALLLRNVHFGCNLATGTTFITSGDVERDLAFCERQGPSDRRLRSLSDSIAHEVAHAMIRDRVGFWRERRLPTWLKEGYCELVAQGTSIDPALGLELLTQGGWTPGLANLKYRLMVEYLLLGRGASLATLLEDPPETGRVEAEMRAALGRDPRAFLERIGSSIGRDDPAGRYR
jgi:hypothetical protein